MFTKDKWPERFKGLSLLFVVGVVALGFLGCSAQEVAKRAGEAAGEVQRRGNELQSSLNQKLSEAAAEAEKKFNVEKNRIIDEYLRNLGENVKGGTDLKLKGEK